MEDELVITVVATGFDSAYFHEKAASLEASQDMAPVSREEVQEVAEEDMQKIDMDLDKEETEAEASFAEEEPKNIWSYNDDESDTPAFLRRKKKDKKKDED
jgi:hypothetical protein